MEEQWVESVKGKREVLCWKCQICLQLRKSTRVLHQAVPTSRTCSWTHWRFVQNFSGVFQGRRVDLGSCSCFWKHPEKTFLLQELLSFRPASIVCLIWLCIYSRWKTFKLHSGVHDVLIETLYFLFTNTLELWIYPDRGVSPPEIPHLPLILLQSRGSRPPPEPGPATDLCELRVCVVFSGQFSYEVFTCSALQPHISQKP